MNEAKVRALKLMIQAVATDAARKFVELQMERHGGGIVCGQCDFCRESTSNLSLLFLKAMEREITAIHAHAKQHSELPSEVIDGFIPHERLN